MPSITHPNGQTTFYQVDDFVEPWKPHDTIVIQHGYGRNGDFWYHWIPALAKKFRVIRRDARGHGRSSVPDKSKGYEYTVETVLDEIVDTLHQLGLQNVHWLGESTGGIWGELLAARNPKRLLSLTICASPLYMPQAAAQLLGFGSPTLWEYLRANDSVKWAENCLVALGNNGFDSEHKKWWISEIAMSPSNSLADHGELIWDKTFDARPIMEGIKVPMLILSPGQSKLIDLKDQKRLHEAVKGSRWEVIEGSGHEIYIDQAEMCQGLYLKFLDEISA